MADNNATNNKTDMEIKFEEYAIFVRDILRPDYQACLLSEEEIRVEINEYVDLIKRITNELINIDFDNDVDPLIMDVDLGHGKVSCRAKVDTTIQTFNHQPTIFVHVGMGFHVEYTWEESIMYIQKRLDYLNNVVLPHRMKKSQKVLLHVHSSERILDELSHELQRMNQ